MQLSGVVKRRRRSGYAFDLVVRNLRLRKAEFLAIVGESGSGKSTLMDIVGLLLQPDEAGCFVFDAAGRCERGAAIDLVRCGRAALSRLRRRHIGYILQTGGLLSFLTVKRNIQLQAQLNGLTGSEATASARAESLGIADQMRKKPQFLSGGQRQRAAIARALSHRPALIIADEPTAAVDRGNARRILQELRHAVDHSGATVVIVTHDIGLIEGRVDRIIEMKLHQTAEGGWMGICDDGCEVQCEGNGFRFMS